MTQDCNKYSGWRILLRVLHAFLLSAKHFLGISGCCRKSQKTCTEHWSLSPAVRGTFRWCWLMFPQAGARWLWLCCPQLSIAGWLKDPEVSLAQVPVPAAQQFVFLQVRGCELGSAVLSPSQEQHPSDNVQAEGSPHPPGLLLCREHLQAGAARSGV